MLVLLSDLHLTDESTSGNVHPDAFFPALYNEIENSVKSKVLGDGAPYPNAELHVVLLGDFFDLVRTDFWVRHYLDAPPAEQTARKAELPWNGKLHPDTAMNENTDLMIAKYQDVLQRIFATKSYAAFCELFRRLKTLADDNRITLQLTYLIGNHDRPLYNYGALRTTVRDSFLTNAGIPVQFPCDPQNVPIPELHLPRYDILIRHGHVWDEQCHGYQIYANVLHPRAALDRCSATAHCVQAIGEVITAEFMAGLVCRIKNRLKANATLEEYQAFYQAVQEINNVRPSSKAFEWLMWLQHGLNEYEQKILTASLNESVTAVLQTELFKYWKRTDFFKNTGVSILEFLVKTGIKKDLPADVGRWLFGKNGNEDVYAKKAVDEAVKYAVQYVVYGHTHNALSVYGSGEPNNRVRMYLNTGTYLPLVQKAETNGFAYDQRMVLLFVYNELEDCRKMKTPTGLLPNKKPGEVSLEFWNGKKRKTYAA